MSEERVTSEESNPPQVVNMTKSGAENVTAGLVRMSQSGAKNIFADEVGMTQSGATGMKAHSVAAHESRILALQAHEVSMAHGGVGALLADEVHLQGNAALALGNRVSMRDGYAFTVAGRDVRAERVETLVLVAGKVDGEVHTLVDTRGAVLAGMVSGLLSGLILLAGSLLFRRRK